MSATATVRLPWWIGASLIVLSLTLCYFPLLSAPFVWTDHSEVEQGALVPTTAQEFLQALTRPKGEAKSTIRQQYFQRDQSRSSYAYHRPIKAFSYGLDQALGGGEAWAFHLSNLLLHGLVSVLLLLLARRLFGSARPGLAEALALWHALNPLHTEVTAWVSARSDSLMTLFVLAALGLQLMARKPSACSWPLRLLSALSLLTAMGSKETGLVGLGLMALLAWGWPEGRGRWRRLAEELILPALALAGAFLWRLGMVGDLDLGRLGQRTGPGFWSGLDLLGRNLQQSLLPLGHGVADTLALVHGPSPFGVFALLALGGWAGLAWRLRRRAPLVAVAGLAWLGSVLPVSQILPLIHPRGDRYLYLPSIFTSACLLAALYQLWLHLRQRPLARRTLLGMLAAGLLAAAAISHVDARSWTDEGRLFRRAVAAEPRCAECWNNLAYHEATRGRLRRAVAASLRGLAVDRRRVRTARDGFSLRFILAQAALELNRPWQAAQALQEIHLKAGPAPATLRQLARAYEMGGRHKDAHILLAFSSLDELPAWEAEQARVFSCRPGSGSVPPVH